MPDRREDVVVAEITARLRRACDDMTDDAFAALVHTIAEAALRYEGSPPPVGFALPFVGRSAPADDGPDPD
jgi:hypothetical protein